MKIRRTDGSATETVRLIGLDTPETKKPGVPVECGGKEAAATMLSITFSAPTDTDGDTLADSEGGRGVLVKVKTDRSQHLRDGFGRLLAYLDTTGDLPPIADGQPYDIGKVQVLAGNSPAYRYEGSRFARYGAYRTTEQQARAANSGVWGKCGGVFHSEQ